MVTKSDRPVDPIRRLALRIALGVTAFLAPLGSASACIPGWLKASDVEFARFVTEASAITVARVVGAKPLPGDPPFDKPTMRFTFQTVERIKGNAPQTFTLAGAPIHHLKEADEYAALVHNGMGEFWSEFRAGCYSAPLAYAVDRNFLIFADAKGKVLLLYYRGSELLSTPTDHWLDAVRALSRDPSLKKGRRARLVDFLTSAKAILVSRTTSCDRLSRNQDTRQIWGTVLTDAEIDHLFTTQRRSACEPGRRQLTVVFADGYGSDVSFDVSGEQDTVDFTGFIDGTEQGIAFETRRATDVTGVLWPVWYSQIDLEGPRVWRLADIEATLKTAAQSKH